ncbi:MAG: riboflavin biosynthesis protein RibF [Chloroflexi bacterium RBG_16_57_8]|nr:MAG: riboflavin biosynthesis protein RibF [Chloroflexi bacterium RBG_16_57_8]
MLAEQEMSELAPDRDMVLTIGVFDGVHLGHKHLLSRLKELAREHRALSCVVTFRRHPQELLAPEASLPYLTSLEQKINLIKAEGVDAVVALTFDEELAGLSARQFIVLLKKHLRMRALLIGSDFALGKDREGSPEELQRIGRDMGFPVTVVPPLRIADEVVSSTAVRQALAAGDMSRVVRLTGRPYSIKGTVVAGTGLGRQLGFPTANLKIDARCAIPADGVYATFTRMDARAYESVTSIGLRPTFSGKERTVETYVLDFEGDVYGRDVTIDIIERLREEKKFASAGELKRQITLDIEKSRAILRAGGLAQKPNTESSQLPTEN